MNRSFAPVIRRRLIGATFCAALLSALVVACGGPGAGAYVDPAIAAQQAQAQAAAQAASLADSQAKSTLVLQLYAGTWMINYDGAEKGNCQGVSVDVQGLILGTCSAVAVTPVIQVLGQVSADGSTSFTLGGIQATGMFPDTDNASGTWISATGSGTFTMARAK